MEIEMVARSMGVRCAAIAPSVLMIDDDPLHLEVARLLLTARGFSITTASDGASARRALDGSRPIDLIMLDLNMPDFDGVELLAHLQSIKCRSSIIIVSSAHKSVRQGASELARVYDLHVLGTIEKPFTGDKYDTMIAPWQALPSGDGACAIEPVQPVQHVQPVPKGTPAPPSPPPRLHALSFFP